MRLDELIERYGIDDEPEIEFILNDIVDRVEQTRMCLNGEDPA